MENISLNTCLCLIHQQAAYIWRHYSTTSWEWQLFNGSNCKKCKINWGLILAECSQIVMLRSSTSLTGVWLLVSWIINRTFSAPDSDSEEHNSSRGGWPPLSGTRSHGSLTRKRRSASSPTSLLSSQKSQKKKHKHLSLLLEEAGLSSSDDSFDQGYWPNLTAPRPSLLCQTKKIVFLSLVTACVFVCVSLRQLFSDCALANGPSTSLACWLLCRLPFFKKKRLLISMVFFLLPGLQTVFCSICTLKNCVNCEIFFIKLYCSLVPISFIKGVDLIGTEREALWSLCLLHLSVCLCQSVQLPLHRTHPLDCSVRQISLQLSCSSLRLTFGKLKHGRQRISSEHIELNLIGQIRQSV